MKVIRANAMGMCFGVKDAIVATGKVENPQGVTIFGELVHNEIVNADLAARGFISMPEVGRQLPRTPGVMITAHGVSDTVRERLRESGKQVIDTTCPLVRRAHSAAISAEAEGWHVVVAGKRGHVEVSGLTGDLKEYTIVEKPEEVSSLPQARIGIICQTTLQPADADAIYRAMKIANPQAEVKLFDTICRPTRERQVAMTELVTRVEAVVVVGGKHSNNTRQLVKVAESSGVPVRHVSSVEEIDNAWVRQFNSIGLTAGTSTPDSLIDAVEARLKAASNPAPAPRFSTGWVPSETWVQWFEWNSENQTTIPWDEDKAIGTALSVIAESLQEFQRGESSEGRGFLSRGFRHAMESNDPAYYDALLLFIAEENRHGAYLGRFLEMHGFPLLEETHTDNAFRLLRSLGGLETTIRVLLTAEIIACAYYNGIAQATDSAALKAICRQILNDEIKHLRFQNERLEILQSGRPAWLKSVMALVQAGMLFCAILVIWPKHGKAMQLGGYTFMKFTSETFQVFLRRILHISVKSLPILLKSRPQALR